MLSCTSTYSTFFTTSRPAKAFSFASETPWSRLHRLLHFSRSGVESIESRESRRIVQLSRSGVVGAVFYNVVPRNPQARAATTTSTQQPLLCVRRYLRAGWEAPATVDFLGPAPGQEPGHGGLSSKSTVFPSWFCCSERTLLATASDVCNVCTSTPTPTPQPKIATDANGSDQGEAHFGRWPGTASPVGQHSSPTSAPRASLRSQSCEGIFFREERRGTEAHAHHSDSLMLRHTSTTLRLSNVPRHGPPSTPDSTNHQDPSLN